MPRQVITSELTNVQKLVFLAMKMDSVSQEEVRGQLVKVRRRAYEQELSLQAARVGCAGRQGKLTTGDSLKELNQQSKNDAASITNTYNADLIAAIKTIASETPSANRNTYVKRLQEWETKRTAWKSQQIAQYTEATARSQAKIDFYKNNGIDGTATLEPRTAKESICQGWINRGEVPLKEALRNPGPFHPWCPHEWVTKPDKVTRAECQDLWMGE